MSERMGERPELGDLTVGVSVVLVRPRNSNGTGFTDPVRCVVAEAARVWVIPRPVDPDSPRSWKMRKDTQDTGDRRYSQWNSVFATPEQYAWDERFRAARASLRDAGIQFDRAKDWHKDPDRLLHLANAIRDYDGLDPL